MRPQIIASTLALAALLSLGACNKPAAAPGADSAAAPVTAAATNVLDCEGPFGPDASKASLSEFFGAANVVDMNVDGPEGTTNSATVLFPNDPARRVEVLRFHGISRLPDQTRDVDFPGGKFNMPDVNAAIGRAQLAKLDRFCDHRRRLAQRYLARLRGVLAEDLLPHPGHAGDETGENAGKQRKS